LFAFVVRMQNWIPAFAGMTVFELTIKRSMRLLMHVVPAKAGT
jgi:hypothetical protein